MKRISCIFIMIIGLAIVASSLVSPTLTIVNEAEEPATVRIIGPSAGYVNVSSGASESVSVSGGTYRLKIRYCNGGNCHYSETDSFTVTQTAYAVSHVTVTLHSGGGTLHEHDISESEFSNSD